MYYLHNRRINEIRGTKEEEEEEEEEEEYFNNQKETIAHKSDTINVIMPDDKNCIGNVFTT